MKFNRVATVCLIGAYSIISACSGSQTAATNDTPAAAETVTSNVPAWFNVDGFVTDGATHISSATAIASTSASAIEKASASARNKLEAALGVRLESVRAELAEAGNSDVTNTDFLIILRNAHAQIVQASTISNSESTSEDGVYRGFVNASISKTELAALLEKGFTGHPRYWGAFSGSPSFAALVN